jgi:hypothetical protein
MYLIISFCFFSACDRADTSLDFIAVYNANKHITYTINLLERRGGEENQSEEPLAEMAALEIQSTRSSMSIEGKMLLGHFPLLNISLATSVVIFCINTLISLRSCCLGPPRRSTAISKIPRSGIYGLHCQYH